MALPSLVTLAQALGPVHQDHLLQARQMQALSFAVHIPLVCFGIAFPAMVLFCEWLSTRTGDPIYRALARRWTRVMVALFAVGVITGTILSFEMGLLWPNFTATFGGVFGLGLRDRGLLVLPGGDLHRDLRLRLGPPVAAGAHAQRHPDRDHRLHRLADGHRGQRVDEPSRRLSPRGGEAVDVAPVRRAVRQHLPLARARPHVPRRLHRHRLRRGRRPTRSRGCAGAGAATSARRWRSR